MPNEWKMEKAHISDWELIERLLRNEWEPFTVQDGFVYFKKQEWTERGEQKSSVPLHRRMEEVDEFGRVHHG